MASDVSASILEDREWRRETSDGEYCISTALRHLDVDFINSSFGTEDMYWAKSIPKEQIVALLAQSLTLGVYKVLPAVPPAASSDSPSSPRTPSPTLESEPQERLQQVGMARFVTDRMTAAYLSDVYIHPDYRAFRLGKWLIECCKEVMDAMPAMRRGFLLANPDVGKKFYERELGFYDMNEEREKVVCMTKRFIPWDS